MPSHLSHPLDRPVWSALTSWQSHLAEGDDRAWRLQPDHGPFAAAADASPASLEALAALIPAGGSVWTVEVDPMPIPPGTVVMNQALCQQMVAEAIAPTSPDFTIVSLTEDDAPEMLALATLTVPGPYLHHTHRMGAFIGVKKAGQLVAMAGERMRLDGFTEVSGVCTHPDFRGRGYAGGLMSVVARGIIARGNAAFLHVYVTNAGAIALYEALGFRIRTTVTATVLARAR